jgi:virulence-associated protein VapD
MYAISFDIKISDLKIHYGELYNNAYYEIKQTLLEMVLNGYKAARIFREAMI